MSYCSFGFELIIINSTISMDDRNLVCIVFESSSLVLKTIEYDKIEIFLFDFLVGRGYTISGLKSEANGFLIRFYLPTLIGDIWGSLKFYCEGIRGFFDFIFGLQLWFVVCYSCTKNCDITSLKTRDSGIYISCADTTGLTVILGCSTDREVGPKTNSTSAPRPTHS